MLFAPKEKGQGLVEYAIILALIAIVVIVMVGFLGKKVNNTFSTVNSMLPWPDRLKQKTRCKTGLLF